MAKLSPKGRMTGVSGPVYFRTLNNLQIVQTRPDRSKQNKENNLSAKLFKRTANSLKILRRSIELFLGNRYESTAHQRLMGQVMKALRKNTTFPITETTVYNTSIEDIIGFEWNTKQLFTDTFLGDIALEVLTNNELSVKIDAFIPVEQVVFPPLCTHASIRIEGFFMNDMDANIGNVTNTLSIDFSKSDKVVESPLFKIIVPVGSDLKVVVAEIQFFYPINSNPNQLTLYNGKDFNPSMVVYVGR